MSSIVVITKYYPFEAGRKISEPFLEPEIEAMAKGFDRVLIMAAYAANGAIQAFPLPDNATAIPLSIPDSKASKAVTAALSFLPSSLVNDKEKSALKTEKVFGKKSVYQRYFARRATNLYKAICRNMPRNIDLQSAVLYSYWLYETALAGIWLKQEFGFKRVVSRAHGYDVYEERNSLCYIPLRRYILSNLDAVIVCSQDGKEYLSSKYPGESENTVSCLYLGSDEVRDRSQDEVKRGRFRLLSCSQIYPLKRVDLLADAISMIHRDDVEVSWVHYGGGSDFERVLKMTENIHDVDCRLTNNVGHDRILSDLSSEHFDLFVNVSSSEGIPVSIMEACSAGIPILATNVGGVKEIVRDGENGILLNVDVDAAGLSQVINEVIDLDEEKMQEWRIMSRSIWESSFDARKNSSSLVKVLIGEESDSCE